jgi:ATP-dependent RNA helicase RhlB
MINDIKAEFMIGDLPQSKRLAIMKSFKAGNVKILVATDVAARGIDVDDLSMVINYDLPVEAENYVHRIGRTARAGKTGKAYTFCSEQDVYNLPAIERYIEMQIPATVAYPDQMEDDKSAGMYIKTENWHGDDELDNRHGYRKGRDGDIHNRARGGDRKDKYKKRGPSTGSGNPRSGEYKKGGNYKKGPSTGSGTTRKPYIDPAKLEGLSYEERMKLYKEAYASGARPQGSGNKNHKKDSYKKNGYNKNAHNKGNYNKNSHNKNGQNRSSAPAPKKTLWQKIKAFFGR